jgi:CAAX prenyl protease-like protein
MWTSRGIWQRASLLSKGAFPRVLPFALFMGFIGLEELARFLNHQGILHLEEKSFLFFYPVKTVAVAAIILFFRSRYVELRWRDLFSFPRTSLSILIGLAVFVLWIHMDWPFATFGKPAGYNPAIFEDRAIRTLFVASRLAGAILVVPVMEELFWRSFLIRYVMSPDFMKMPIGHFAWFSFILTTVLFGLEHNLWLAGMMAGVAYNLILYYTKSISQCITAHAVTNLCLGLYVLNTGAWNFW